MAGGTFLIENGAATGSEVAIGGGQYLLRAEGTWGGATAQLQIESANGTFVNVTDASFTANGVTRVFLPGGVKVKMAVSGGPPSGLYVDLLPFGVS